MNLSSVSPVLWYPLCPFHSLWGTAGKDSAVIQRDEVPSVVRSESYGKMKGGLFTEGVSQKTLLGARFVELNPEGVNRVGSQGANLKATEMAKG